MILSLQGCMAVGKTTAVRCLQEYTPDIHISYEDNSNAMIDAQFQRYEPYLKQMGYIK